MCSDSYPMQSSLDDDAVLDYPEPGRQPCELVAGGI
jgi:hypothetical protein